MLIAMAGLPGTGKSTLAERLAEQLGGVVLCKDVVRAALFPPLVLDYSREQDDLTLQAMYRAAQHILGTSRVPVIIDGRTFSKAYQVRDLIAAAESMGEPLRIIECICSDDVARERIERDAHPAANRTFEMYRELQARAEPLILPRLVLDTGKLSLEECVQSVMASASFLGQE